MVDYPYQMRRPRRAKPLTGETRSTWFYVLDGGIQVMAHCVGGGITGAHLTRDQLARALQLLDQHSAGG